MVCVIRDPAAYAIKIDPANRLDRLSNRAIEGDDTKKQVVKFSSLDRKTQFPEMRTDVKAT